MGISCELDCQDVLREREISRIRNNKINGFLVVDFKSEFKQSLSARHGLPPTTQQLTKLACWYLGDLVNTHEGCMYVHIDGIRASFVSPSS